MRMRPLLKDSFWVFAGRASNLLGGLGVQVMLARLLPPAELGRYFVLSSAVAVVSMLATLNVGLVAVREVAALERTGAGARASGLARAAVQWGTLGGLGAGGLFFVVAAVIDQSLLLPALAAGWVAALSCESVLADVLRGLVDIRAASMVDEILTGWLGLLIVLSLAAIAPPLTLARTVGGLGTGLLIALAFGSAALWRHLRQLPRASPAPALGWWWKEASPVWLNTGLGLVLAQMDVWVLSCFRPPAEVAVYGLASRLAILFNQPQVMTRAVLMPRIAGLYAQGRTDLIERMVRGAATLAGGLALVGTLVLALIGDWGLGALFGDGYRVGLPVALILAVGYVASNAAGLGATTLLMTGHQTLVLRGSLLVGSVTGLLLVVLTAMFGGTGAAIAMACGSLLQNVVMIALVRRTHGIWTWASFRWTEWQTAWRWLGGKPPVTDSVRSVRKGMSQ